MSSTIQTKYGSCRINGGYYTVSSRVEGNRDKQLHRLVYEDYYNICLLNNAVVHHIDGNKLNNNISNLQVMTINEHNSLHSKGENNCMYGKTHTDIVKKRISELNKGRKRTKNECYSQSSHNGLPYRVCKHKGKDYKNGFIYDYKYFDKDGKRKRLSSTNMNKLYLKVIKNGLEWNWLNYNPEVKT